ncbi:MAG TPA: sigma-54 dependent transcriptional regulator [Patescibacteria group bacterium]|nr:sigma-54 dependent transcriptional regulator [Patescibacteria group bacterium]
MKNPGKILIIDDDRDVLTAARLLLKQHYETVCTEVDPRQIPALLKSEKFDVILLDMNFTQDAGSGREGFHWLSEIRKINPAQTVVLITAYGGVEMAVQAMKQGAADFVLKPWHNDKLVETVAASMKSRSVAGESKKRTSYFDMIGSSPAMQSVFLTIEKIAPTDANILILGENGTGKELVARAIHQASRRANGPFINVDVGALSETIFESELFGYTKGAFTDAKEDRAGRFELAHGGTIFLDEIGNLPFAFQHKFLSILQNREVIRLGSHTPRKIDVRLISATNMPLREMVEKKQFRQDLLYRMNTVELHLPPLRARRDDIALLANHFLKTYAQKYEKSFSSLSTDALKKLGDYAWPGNVRELQHVVERAVIMNDSGQFSHQDFLLNGSPGAGISEEETLNLEETERTLIRKAISKHGGNLSHAAKELGLTRASLYRRLEKYGL